MGTSNSQSPEKQVALRPYQVEAVAAVEAGTLRGINRPAIVLPTGTGKTVIFTDLIRRRGGRSLVLAHRDELLDQAIDKLSNFYPAGSIGKVKAGLDECDAPIVVASIQTLARQHRLSRLTPDFRTVVVDEAHHAAAETYGRVLEYVGAFSDGGPLTLGVTATAERADGLGLDDIFEEIVYSKDLLEMIRQRYLADIRAIRIHLEADFDEVHTRAGDLIASELDDAMREANAPSHAVQAYQEHATGRKAIIFTATVAMAYEMAQAFRDAGISAEALDGTVPGDERKAIINRLHTGETKVLANCAVLTEGFDEPSIDCIVIARPTKSRPLYVQMIGRGTRTFPGKPDCLVIDLVGTSKRHKLVTVPTLFGLEVDEMGAGESVIEATGAHDKILAEQEAHGRIVAETVDLFDCREMRWVTSDESRFVLSVGDGMLILQRSDLSSWTVEHVKRDRERHQIAADLDLGYAQGVAEDYARKMGAGVLVSKTAWWRQETPTEKQKKALRKWRIPIPKNLTKGEASDLLAAAFGRSA